MIAFAEIPAWTYEGAAPSTYTFFTAIALAGLEERTIRLDARTQRALLGAAVFGRRVIKVHRTSEVTSTIQTDFGRDYESATYSASRIGVAVETGHQLRPGAGYVEGVQ